MLTVSQTFNRQAAIVVKAVAHGAMTVPEAKRELRAAQQEALDDWFEWLQRYTQRCAKAEAEKLETELKHETSS